MSFFIRRTLIHKTSGQRQNDHERISIHLTFSKDRGVQIEYPESLANESKEMLSCHSMAAEVERKEKGLEGESIFLVLDRLDRLESRSRYDWLELKLEDKIVESFEDE